MMTPPPVRPAPAPPDVLAAVEALAADLARGWRPDPATLADLLADVGAEIRRLRRELVIRDGDLAMERLAIIGLLEEIDGLREREGD